MFGARDRKVPIGVSEVLIKDRSAVIFSIFYKSMLNQLFTKETPNVSKYLLWLRHLLITQIDQ